MKNNLAPIVLFVYNRPEHTRKTLHALQNNKFAPDSELIIYSDASKDDSSADKVNEVRVLISNVTGFKRVTIIEQEKNQGLSNSIINGVTEVVNRYGKVIVLEDDLVTSPYFLTFMNDALNFYEKEKRLWHISGWNYPIEIESFESTFLWRVMNCWGWATWADRWQYYEKDSVKITLDFNKKDIKRFNLDGAENFFSQIVANKEGKINTWAIFWYATIFKQNGMCLNPINTYVNNIGFDGSGVHCGENELYKGILNMSPVMDFPLKIEENLLVVMKIKEELKLSPFCRVKNRIIKGAKRLKKWI